MRNRSLCSILLGVLMLSACHAFSTNVTTVHSPGSHKLEYATQISDFGIELISAEAFSLNVSDVSCRYVTMGHELLSVASKPIGYTASYIGIDLYALHKHTSISIPANRLLHIYDTNRSRSSKHLKPQKKYGTAHFMCGKVPYSRS